MLSFTLPVPPPANNAYINLKRGGRAKSKSHKAWIKNADGFYMLQHLGRHPKIEVPFYCKMIFPHNMHGDLDGRIKLILDWLWKRDLTCDDRYCSKLETERCPDTGESLVWVLVQPAE